MHDLDHQVRRLERLDDLGADGFGLDVTAEVTGDLEMDVGLEQRRANLAHHLLDVFLGDTAATTETAKNVAQSIG